jgi:hypothetical protein
MTDKKTIYEAIGSVISELGGIGKSGRNKEQGYNFRGIDDVLKEVHPLLGKHGVFFAPQVLERIYEERVSKQGNTGHVAHLHVQYTVYGPDGSSVVLSTWGEGLDYSDKATNKAMTAAFKYALFELFAISDPTEDADSETPEGTGTAPPRQSRPNAAVSPQTGEIDPRVHAIEEAAKIGSNPFVVDLAKKWKQYGKLSEPQLDKGFEAAARVLGEERVISAPAREEIPFEPVGGFDEEGRFS